MFIDVKQIASQERMDKIKKQVKKNEVTMYNDFDQYQYKLQVMQDDNQRCLDEIHNIKI